MCYVMTNLDAEDDRVAEPRAQVGRERAVVGRRELERRCRRRADDGRDESARGQQRRIGGPRTAETNRCADSRDESARGRQRQIRVRTASSRHHTTRG